MRVLYLTQWYPHRYDAMAGLFVRKHAEAVARQGVDVCVLYLHPDESVDGMDVVEQTTFGVREIYVYHSVSFLKALTCGWQFVRRHWGIPDVCQVNVLTKTALLPYYLKCRYGIPYVVVEHWSGYLPENFSLTKSAIRLRRWLGHSASCIMPVSARLETAMKSVGIGNAHWCRVHNVVDDFFYSATSVQTAMENKKWQLLHVSCFDEKAKNTQGILRVMSRLKDIRADWHLAMVGTGQDIEAAKALAEKLGLTTDWVSFVGEQTPKQVAQWMRESDLFVLFSRYENAPVVLSECMAVGLPVLTTNAGGIPEMMVVPELGEMVAVEDEEALLSTLCNMLEHYEQYPSETIREHGACYREDEVARSLIDCYQQAISAARTDG